MTDQSLIDTVQQLVSQVELLTQQVKAQQETINRQQALITSLQNASSTHSVAASAKAATTSRRKLLKGLAAGMLVGLAGTAAAIAASPGTAEAKVFSNPHSNIGAIILPPGAHVNPASAVPTNYYGLLATNSSQLNFEIFPNSDIAIGASCDRGYGVVGTATGNGISAIYGFSNSDGGNGVSGISGGFRAAGVYGFSSLNIGVYAMSATGSPLHLEPGAAPSTGTRGIGDMYVDTTGKLYIWATTAANTVGWRQVQFAT